MAFYYAKKGDVSVENNKSPTYELAEQDYMAGMKYKDIAEKYGVSINTVKSWKGRYNWSKDKKSVHTKKKKVCTQNGKSRGEKDINISWVEIENEYVTDIRKKPCSLEFLSEKYDIPLQTIKDYSSRHKWSQKRTEYKLNTNQKIVEKTAEIISDDIAKYKAQHLSITDNILNQINKALDNPNELYSFVEKFREGNGDGSYTEYSDVKIHDTLNENKVVKIVTAVEKLQRMQRQTLDILSVDAQERLELERKKVEIAQSKVPSKEQVSLQGQITALADLINNPVEERVLDDD